MTVQILSEAVYLNQRALSSLSFLKKKSSQRLMTMLYPRNLDHLKTTISCPFWSDISAIKNINQLLNNNCKVYLESYSLF